ncbi:aspartate--tRNA ligase [Kosmotoga olearia]|uniref:Aspartate--tRNA ligase n=1 Tax=Kosmotoga olearia (strain ATCC BAA-1733 / DSM 21960 / TBF 19.5.1) TaxID=521045 RepID=C5CIU7_KOSOT|nr:aspartate--tRNA ligase [Kosmotoga olearia]ACR78936.1 aspartyl-tRNA synthetase [Kosmotoga olearia TBF 19.5.1]
MKKRTHTCGELRSEHAGKTVVLNGWVDRIRDLGGIKFILLRDRYGFTQVVFDPSNEDVYKTALQLGIEYTISVTGIVRERPKDAVNPKMPTGKIEVLATEVEILSESDTPPIYVNIDDDSSEELKLKYRYLNLRKPKMQRNIIFRHKVVQAVRNYLNKNNFLEIETPVLTKSTPEGARDFLVPSRLRPGKFYALPQSPQLFKQLLMVAGFDRYYQIAKCYRDEDFRADRQPEFTQIDLEMSFADSEDVFAIVEGMLSHTFKETLNVGLTTPFPRLTYEEAMEMYGSDRPDRRYGMELHDVSEAFVGTGFRVISEALGRGEIVKGFLAKGLSSKFSRKRLDEYTAFVKENGLGGLIWIKVEDELRSSILKHCPDEIKKVVERFNAKIGDIIFLAIGKRETVSKALGKLREKLISEEKPEVTGFDILWVTDFPMFSYNEEEGRIEAEHHPFTMPNLGDLDKFGKTEPLKVRSHAYDLVINGYELASGSVRIHRRDIQNRIFEMIGLTHEEAQEKFGFLLEAFKYGPPPHAGIAFGLDRLVAIMVGTSSIRDVIAFPKAASGNDPMTGAPSEVSERQLEELRIKIIDEKDGKKR